MKLGFVTLILFFLLTGCSGSNHEDASFRKVKNLSFNSGFSFFARQLEVFGGHEYLCLTDYTTQKELILYELNNDEQITINLDEIVKAGEKIQAVEVINPDSVLVLTTYTNKLFMVNREGEVWKKIDLNPYLIKTGKFELVDCNNAFLFNDTTCVFELGFKLENLPLKEWNNPKAYYQERYTAPRLVTVSNIFKDTLKLQFGLEEVYARFTRDDQVSLETNCFSFSNNFIFFKSYYSDTLYQIDPRELIVSKKTPLFSRYSGLSRRPISIEENSTNRNALAENFSSSGKIASVHYDAQAKRYFIFVTHKKKHEKDHSWSILVLNDALELRNELKMEESAYACFGMMSSEGLLVLNRPKPDEDQEHFKKNNYTLFSYE